MSKTAERLGIKIETAYDFSEVACEILDVFMEDFDFKDGLTREPTQEDYDAFGGFDEVGFIYTDKAMGLYDRACKRLSAIGERNFPLDLDKLDIKSCHLIEP